MGIPLLQPRGAGDTFGGLSDEFAPEVPGLGIEGSLGETCNLLRGQHPGAAGSQSAEEGITHRGIDDELMLRTADYPVVEALATNHEARGLVQVCVSADPGRGVPRTEVLPAAEAELILVPRGPAKGFLLTSHFMRVGVDRRARTSPTALPRGSR
jgi:hypothetical protein